MALTVKFILIDWAEWTGTSIPGPLAMVYAFNTLSRIIWAILLATVYAIFFYQVYLIAAHLLSNPAVIQVSMGFSQKVPSTRPGSHSASGSTLTVLALPHLHGVQPEPL